MIWNLETNLNVHKQWNSLKLKKRNWNLYRYDYFCVFHYGFRGVSCTMVHEAQEILCVRRRHPISEKLWNTRAWATLSRQGWYRCVKDLFIRIFYGVSGLMTWCTRWRISSCWLKNLKKEKLNYEQKLTFAEANERILPLNLFSPSQHVSNCCIRCACVSRESSNYGLDRTCCGSF